MANGGDKGGKGPELRYQGKESLIARGKAQEVRVLSCCGLGGEISTSYKRQERIRGETGRTLQSLVV